MPCAGPPDPDRNDLRAAALVELVAELSGKPYNHKKVRDPYGPVHKIDEMTRQLCDYFKDKPSGHVEKFSLEMQIWWRDHQEEDRVREAREAHAKMEKRLRKEALAKLTPAEKRALGIK